MKPLILVCTDFSECSDRALARAAELAARNDSRLLILHVSSPPGLLKPGSDGWNEEAMGKLKHIRRSRFRSFSDNDVQYDAIASPQPATAISEVAAKHRASLVVLGSHGRTGVMRQLLGSVAESVVRHAPCSVLVVRS